MEYRRIDLILGLPIRSCAGLRAVSGKRGFAPHSMVVRRSDWFRVRHRRLLTIFAYRGFSSDDAFTTWKSDTDRP